MGLEAMMSAGGDMFSAFMNYKQGGLNRDFQRDMANSQHQREVADLTAAGLNPILSATGGSGNAVPAGASGAIGNIFDNAANLSLAAKQQAKQQELIDAQIKQTNANTDKSVSEKAAIDYANSLYMFKYPQAQSEAASAASLSKLNELEYEKQRLLKKPYALANDTADFIAKKVPDIQKWQKMNISSAKASNVMSDIQNFPRHFFEKYFWTPKGN